MASQNPSRPQYFAWPFLSYVFFPRVTRDGLSETRTPSLRSEQMNVRPCINFKETLTGWMQKSNSIKFFVFIPFV